MKASLKRARDGNFLRDSDRWTDDSAEALNFKTTPAQWTIRKFTGFEECASSLNVPMSL